jgi:cytochrome c5
VKSSLLKLAAALAMATLVLNACSDGPSESSAANETKSRQLRPTDTQIAAIYDRSCRSCHTIAATGAPLTGDAVAWAPRMAKGMPTLVDNVVGGFGGMPPFGMCMDCSAEEFEALISFMATAPQAKSGKVGGS